MAEAAAPPARLVVIGAGPKGLAIAAKHAVLRQLGYAVPELVILDRLGPAAHWSGEHGFTDGRRELGTLPEKDVGFPYDSLAWGSAAMNQAVDRAMLAYSWQAYLVATYRYAAWIDRDRTRPLHREWSAYLRWVAEQVRAPIVTGDVRELGLADAGRRWRITYRVPATGASQVLEADGVVLTGPGSPVRLPGQPAAHPRVFDGATVWQALAGLAHLHEPRTEPLRVGIVGTGETAAAAVVALLETLGDGVRIEVLSPRGVLFTRDEGYEENRLFSNPDPHDLDDGPDHQHPLRWLSLTEDDRREFVRRADRGVFSVQAVREMTRAWNVRSVVGNATAIDAQDDGVTVTTVYGATTQTLHYAYVVVARGFDPLDFLRWLDAAAQVRLTQAAGDLSLITLERQVGHDLAITGMAPRLHVPMLAGVAQGPGFPNLSSLGLLAERVLAAYVRPAAAAQQ